MSWEVVIGLEVHVQLATQSKIFSGAATAYGAQANTQACAVDLGLPGVLPVLNQRAVEMGVRFGLAIDAEITSPNVFARKHYFYPDLPKGYQISQFELPIVAHGHLDIPVGDAGDTKRIRILRAHLEEDAGKSIHDAIPGATGIDLNRAGTPLLEVVSEPDMRSAAEAVAYLRMLHELVRCIGVCDGNMQEGSFRCDANVSVRRSGDEKLGTRTETKNLNSFRFVEKAILFEVERQIEVLESGGVVEQETRLFDPDAGETRAMRSKEDAMDYRYFPDPDLLPVICDEAFIEEQRAQLPELPAQRRERYVRDYQLGAEEARLLSGDPDVTAYFESLLAEAGSKNAALAARWQLGELAGRLNAEGVAITESPVSAAALAGLVQRLADDTLSGKMGKQVFSAMWDGEGSADEIIEKRGLKQVSDTGALEAIIAEVIAAHPDQVQQIRDGKTKVIGFLVGKVMQQTRGQANPGLVNKLLMKQL